MSSTYAIFRALINFNIVEKFLSDFQLKPYAAICIDFRCPLFMQCVDEGLSEAQKRARVERSSKFMEQMKKLEEMAKTPR